MVHVRKWGEQDAPEIGALQTAFTTGLIYQVIADEACFCLQQAVLDAPLTKAYPITHPENPDNAFVAEVDGRIVGYAELVVESWNKRGNVRHLYVSDSHRRKGIGSALLSALEASARALGARSLWIETQNVNYPAIQFYQRIGFALVGWDRSLYGPVSESGEVAVFFNRDL